MNFFIIQLHNKLSLGGYIYSQFAYENYNIVSLISFYRIVLSYIKKAEHILE